MVTPSPGAARLLDHAIWWHVYPLRALGAPDVLEGDPGDAPVEHRLPDLVGWLDHVVELGCSGLLLGPVFASRSHGYDTLDHSSIDPRLGDEGDLDRVLEECRGRGLAVLLDGVFNHVAADHPLTRDEARAGMLKRGEDGRPAAWEGHEGLVELDHSSPEVEQLVVDVMLHWLRRGISGWRLDVAYAVPTDFWARGTSRVREEFPDALFVGEVIHGDYAEFVQASEVDTVTQYQLWKAVWSSIKDTNCWELAHALERHDALLETFVPQTFVSNHDVTRIATQVGEPGAVLALAVLMTVGGMPSVYYGDERAYQGLKEERLGGDDAIRPALPSGPDALAEDGAWMQSLHRSLIALRRQHPWLARARTSVDERSNEAITYTSSGQDRWVRVELVLAPEASVTVTGADGELFRWVAGD
ncbi:Neopullulanase [Serinicoccus hydrothermalis]|uniref:Neopullulanase n=1 Tax=Serinicoccus hydrothermalis TaxID=1758689 RepID=A0A1B1NDF0_9MICO|nr:alpha-amylase family protein [Serinicoccus hydrothermalis]ANS79446.1 Neopullulanase [Serinicoccus hydrothermalis]